MTTWVFKFQQSFFSLLVLKHYRQKSTKYVWHSDRNLRQHAFPAPAICYSIRRIELRSLSPSTALLGMDEHARLISEQSPSAVITMEGTGMKLWLLSFSDIPILITLFGHCRTDYIHSIFLVKDVGIMQVLNSTNNYGLY